ncbi:MAG: hypothetical protein M1482_04915 [Chloroflexi bacterium]|nr:hypothetical protein [Chloroflexota bacterium]
MSSTPIDEPQVPYGEFALAANSDAGFIKLAISFQRRLRAFKGAPLSAFLALATNEPEVSLGRSRGLSVYDIAAMTDYSVRATISALGFLNEQNYASEIGRRGIRGLKRYRVSAYAWFGGARAPAPPDGLGLAAEPANGEPVENCRALQKNAPVVVGTTDLSSGVLSQQQTEARRILQTCGINEPALGELAEIVQPKLARTWHEWLEQAPSSFSDPVGYMITLLSRDIAAKPPGRARARRHGAAYDGAVSLRRSDFTAAQWRRLAPVNRRAIIAFERGIDDPALVEDDPEYASAGAGKREAAAKETGAHAGQPASDASGAGRGAREPEDTQ